MPGPNCGQVLDPTIANGVTTLLQGVLAKGGTGYGLALGRPAAGKTGTDDEYKNAWFSGYTPNLAASVWVGNPDSTTPMRGHHGQQQEVRRGLRRDAARADLAACDEGCAGESTDRKLHQATGRRVARRAESTIPNVQGEDPTAAAAALTKLGLSPAVDPTQVTSSQPLGKVETTVPAAGTSVYAGAAGQDRLQQRRSRRSRRRLLVGAAGVIGAAEFATARARRPPSPITITGADSKPDADAGAGTAEPDRPARRRSKPAPASPRAAASPRRPPARRPPGRRPADSRPS